METLENTIAIAITLAFILYTATIDADHLKKKQYIDDHIPRFMQRAIFFIALGLCSPIYILASALLFTSLFDQTLNLLRGINLYHLGNTSHWDRFFKTKPILYTITKLSCLICALYLFLFFN